MDKTFLFIVLGIIAVLSLSLTVTIILFVKSRKKWLLNSQNQYVKGKEDGKAEAVEIINATINRIENDKNKLTQMSEKELMVSTMMALATYGRRLDETNARLDTIIEYKTYISEMNKQMQVLSNSYDSLQNTVKTAEKSLNDSIMSSQTQLNEAVESSKQSVNSFKNSADTATNSVNTLNTRLSVVENIRQRVDEINVDLRQSLELLESLQSQSSSIMTEMDGMLQSYGQSPTAKLDQINHNMSELFDRVEKLYRKFKDVDEDELENIQDVHNKIKELYDKTAYVDISDVDRISDIESQVSNVDSKICNVESLLSDIESKMSDVESKMSDVESKISDVADRFN